VVTPAPNTQFTYAQTTFCKSGGSSISAILTGTSQTGYFTASPSGLVFENDATGEINITASNAGNYSITYHASTVCGNYAYTSPSKINIINAPGVFNVVGGGDFCTGTGGVPVGLDNAEAGVTYQLYRDGTTLVASHTPSTNGAFN